MAELSAAQLEYVTSQRLGRIAQWPFVSEGWIRHLPGMLGNWTAVRDLRPMPSQTFRDWWREREKGSSND